MSPESTRDEILKGHMRRIRMLWLGSIPLIVGFSVAMIQMNLPNGSFSIFILIFALLVAIVSVAMRSATLAKLRGSKTQQMGDWELKLIQRNVRRIQRYIAILAISLVVGVIVERHAPLPPVFVGVMMNLLMQLYLIRILLRLKKRLALASDPAGSASQPPAQTP